MKKQAIPINSRAAIILMAFLIFYLIQWELCDEGSTWALKKGKKSVGIEK